MDSGLKTGLIETVPNPAAAVYRCRRLAASGMDIVILDVRRVIGVITATTTATARPINLPKS